MKNKKSDMKLVLIFLGLPGVALYIGGALWLEAQGVIFKGADGMMWELALVVMVVFLGFIAGFINLFFYIGWLKPLLDKKRNS